MKAGLLCAAGAFALVASMGASAFAAGCSVNAGGRVILSSDAVDPDVFVWDSRDRLVDYAAGHWGSTRVIFEHTILAKPGTRALVVACAPAFAHPRYSIGPQDAVGVKVVTGQFRGHYGWVLSSDLHVLEPDGKKVVNQQQR